MIVAKDSVKFDDNGYTAHLNIFVINSVYSGNMKNSSKQIDRKILKTLEPLNRLNPILLDELAAKSIVEEVPADKIICRHGEADPRQIYLLSGQIEVVTPGEKKSKIIKSKSAVKAPIAEGSPRCATLKAKTSSTLLYIDSDLLELLMSDEPELNQTYEVTEITADDGDDWMLSFLQSPAFLQLPTENIQQLLTHMEEIPVKKDQVVITQGGTDDNYYIIKSGSCNVHRQPYKGSANVLLATLPTGSGFGEEALISNGTRNATITMREDGSLMRLKKKDFLRLLINPLIPYFEHTETLKKLDEGCVVIDVRSEKESAQKPIEGSVNIPLSMLRVKFDSLNPEREYLLVCNDGSQSAAAAFLMIQNGLKCSVLKGGTNNSKGEINAKASTKPASAVPIKESTASTQAKAQAAVAQKQTEQIAAQQAQIKAAREKSEKDIIKHKKELEESRARIAQKTKKLSSKQPESTQQKIKASEDPAKAQALTKADNLRKEESNKAVLRAEELVKQSAAKAEQTRKQAEQEAALIKQRAIEEAEILRAEKASQELAKAQAESEAIKQQQKDTNDAMQRAEEMMKQSAAAAESARKQAEKEAALIKQRAIEEAEYLRAEVEASRQKMEQDAARLKEEEKVIKDSALKMRNEADEIRRKAMDEAEQVRSEIDATRVQLEEKLQRTQEEEKRKHDAILAAAKKEAGILSAQKTQQAATEAEAVRKKAKEDAARLHNELEETRKQIEAEAARVISELKEQSKQAAAAQDVHVIEEEVLVEVVSEATPMNKKTDENVDYSAVSIPGMSAIEPLNESDAKRKAEHIKAKLAQSQTNKIHKTKDSTILEGDDDLFIFKEPDSADKVNPAQTEQPAVSHRTRAEAELTQISTTPQNSVVIYPKQAPAAVDKNNPFLNQNESAAPATNYAKQESSASNIHNAPQFDKQAYMRKHQGSKSNTLAIAASFLLILAGAVFTLHATNTLKVQSIAALFNSGNDTVQPAATAIAKTKTIRKKVLRADTKVNVKKKVGNKVDDIMQGWQNVLDEAKNPKK